MKIIQLIKKFLISFKNVKELNAPGLEYAEGVECNGNHNISVLNKKEDVINQYELYKSVENSDTTKTDKVVKILKSIGCKDENLIENCDYEDIDIKNFKDNLITLTEFKTSKIELSIAISGNYDLIYADNNIINNSISSLKKWIGDESVVKNLVYNKSSIINNNTEEKIENVYRIFQEYQIPKDNIKYILDDNPDILTMDENRLKESLNVIRDCFESQRDYINEITDNAILVGIIDAGFIKKYVSEE